MPYFNIAEYFFSSNLSFSVTSQVNTKRYNERQQNYASRRDLGSTKGEAIKEEKEKMSKKPQEDSKTGGEGRGAPAATRSRREKLKEYLEQKRIIEEAKKKKAKPVFKAGKVQYTYPGSTCPGPVSQSCSMSQSMMSSTSTSTVFKKPQGGKGKMLRSCSTLSLDRGRNETLPLQRNPTTVANLKSFAPCNYKFSLNMKYKNTNNNKTKMSNQENNSTMIKVNKEAPNEVQSVEVAEESPKQEVKVVDNLKENSLSVEIQKEDEETKESVEVAKESPKQEVEVVSTLKETNPSVDIASVPVEVAEESPSVEIQKEDAETKERKVEEFRNLLKSETERLSKLCEKWEDLSKSEEALAEDVAGEVRSVLGLARLVMAERFCQFAGLIDNCQFRKGEKETNVEDLRGFWEMISLQVEDVDKKFVSLKEMKENHWERPQQHLNVEKPSRPKLKSVSSSTKTKPASQASSGLKALIALRRKEGCRRSPAPAADLGTSPAPGDLLLKEPSEMTFDGGFFKVTSPCLRKTPKLKSNALTVRQTVVGNSASNLLSPFISALGKMSLSSG